MVFRTYLMCVFTCSYVVRVCESVVCIVCVCMSLWKCVHTDLHTSVIFFLLIFFRSLLILVFLFPFIFLPLDWSAWVSKVHFLSQMRAFCPLRDPFDVAQDAECVCALGKTICFVGWAYNLYPGFWASFPLTPKNTACFRPGSPLLLLSSASWKP